MFINGCGLTILNVNVVALSNVSVRFVFNKFNAFSMHLLEMTLKNLELRVIVWFSLEAVIILPLIVVILYGCGSNNDWNLFVRVHFTITGSLTLNVWRLACCVRSA